MQIMRFWIDNETEYEPQDYDGLMELSINWKNAFLF